MKGQELEAGGGPRDGFNFNLMLVGFLFVVGLVSPLLRFFVLSLRV